MNIRSDRDRLTFVAANSDFAQYPLTAGGKNRSGCRSPFHHRRFRAPEIGRSTVFGFRVIRQYEQDIVFRWGQAEAERGLTAAAEPSTAGPPVPSPVVAANGGRSA